MSELYTHERSTHLYEFCIRAKCIHERICRLVLFACVFNTHERVLHAHTRFARVCVCSMSLFDEWNKGAQSVNITLLGVCALLRKIAIMKNGNSTYGLDDVLVVAVRKKLLVRLSALVCECVSEWSRIVSEEFYAKVRLSLLRNDDELGVFLLETIDELMSLDLVRYFETAVEHVCTLNVTESTKFVTTVEDKLTLPILANTEV